MPLSAKNVKNTAMLNGIIADNVVYLYCSDLLTS